MSQMLNLDVLPSYSYSAFKIFKEGEKHITRYCEEDVLILMLEGILHFEEDRIPIALTKGQYYIQKRRLFQEGILPSSDARYYYIHFYGNFSESKNALPICGSAFFTENYDGFEKLDFLQRTSACAVEKNAEFYRILTKIKSECAVSQNRRIVLQVISMITQDYRKTYTLEELAVRCGYSKNYLIHIFRQETGQTPFSFIAALRLKEAKRLLTDSNLPIGEISERCGFGNYINFYKSFRTAEKTSPENWRKLSRGL